MLLDCLLTYLYRVFFHAKVPAPHPFGVFVRSDAQAQTCLTATSEPFAYCLFCVSSKDGLIGAFTSSDDSGDARGGNTVPLHPHLSLVGLHHDDHGGQRAQRNGKVCNGEMRQWKTNEAGAARVETLSLGSIRPDKPNAAPLFG